MRLNPNKKSFSRYLRRRQTDSEGLLWSKLRNRQFLNLKFRRQQIINNYIVDFICFEKKIIIEIDGGQHNEDNKIISDKYRSNLLENEGYRVIRFWNNEVLLNIEGVMEKIEMEISFPSPPPSPTRGEGAKR